MTQSSHFTPPAYDLFPDAMLVQSENWRIYTTSLKVAEYSGKRHTHVLRAIESKLKDLPDSFTEPNFGLSTYLDSTGRELPMYKMTEQGFALTMMGFTGREALRWQVAFVEAFMQQRAQLAAMQARYAAALDMVRPSLRPVVEGTQAGLPRAAIAQTLGRSARAVTYHRSRARALGLLPALHQVH